MILYQEYFQAIIKLEGLSFSYLNLRGWTWFWRLSSVDLRLQKAASKYSDRLKIVKMEIDPNPATVKQFQVEGVPALRFIVNEQVLGTVEGVIGNDKLIDFIDTYLEKN